MGSQFDLDTTSSVFCNTGGRPIFGRDIAHSHRSAGERGAVAAQLSLSERQLVQPTAKQAALILHASAPYVHIARLLKPATRAKVARGEISLTQAAKTNGLYEAWLLASDEEKAALGVAVGVNTVWDEAIAPSI
jgi:hypothetical protein